jgi:hypothetical protein
VFDAVAGEVSEPLAQALTIADKLQREAELDRVKGLAKEKLSAVRLSAAARTRSAPPSGR